MKNTINPIHAKPTARFFDSETGRHYLCKHVETSGDKVTVDAFMTCGIITINICNYSEPCLSNYGIERVAGMVTTNGIETYIPASMLWFSLPVEVLHLPGSEDGLDEIFTEAEFEAYCLAMAE